MKEESECPFCVLVAGADNTSVESKQSDIFYRDDNVIAFISAGWWPNNPGSVLIIPKTHHRNIYDIPKTLYNAVNEFGRRLAVIMKREYECDGISLDSTMKRPVDNRWSITTYGFSRDTTTIVYTSCMQRDQLYRSKCEINMPAASKSTFNNSRWE